jgi:putative transposase
MNSNKDVQFTSSTYTKLLLDNGIEISKYGKGKAIDNNFIERLWRTVKYEKSYLKYYKDGVYLYKGLVAYFNFYNFEC